MRSAKAPAISAGVMMAKVIWNIEKTNSGMFATPGSHSVLTVIPACIALEKPPR